jgi:hypothetical protein
MKLTSKAFILNLVETVSIGELKATLVCLVNGDKEQFYTDFIDIEEISYMGIEIDGYDNWQKFKTFHLEMGINFQELLDKKFEATFSKEALKQIVDKIKF